jgi:hypothetical protein
MSRRELIVLVSRAIAILQLISAILDAFISLPLQGYLAMQRAQMQSQMRIDSNFSISQHLSNALWIGLSTTILRIVVLLVIAAFFWNAGPTIEGWLAPKGDEADGVA